MEEQFLSQLFLLFLLIVKDVDGFELSLEGEIRMI